MEKLVEYILEHSKRGACMCGKCVDVSAHPEEHQPNGHTANVEFFKVSLKNNPVSQSLKKPINDHNGEFCEINLFDGNEHNYLDIGAWIGDQGTALALMGMGELLGLWKLLTPTSMGMPPELAQMMAQQGMVSIIHYDVGR